MDTINQFLGELSRKSSDQEQIQTLTNHLSLDLSINPYIVRINNIPQVIQLDINKYELYNNEWLAFNELVQSFIRFSNQLNPWSSLESFDLYTTYLNDLSIAFNNNSRGYMLSYLVRDSISIILPLLIKLDYQLYYKENCLTPRLSYLALILLKMFNNIRSQINDLNHIKKMVILFVSNKLCSVYFKLGNPMLCRNIFSNMNNANLQFTQFPLVEQMQYRYYLAKFYMIKDQLIDSFQHLSWCLINCPRDSTNNINRILKNLLPVGIAIGKPPNFQYLVQMYYPGGNIPEFFHIYIALTKSMKQGSFQLFDQVITRYSQYLKDQSLLVMLSSKGKLILLRNLIRKVWLEQGAPSTLNYDSIKLALRLSLGSTHFIGNIDDEIIENVFVTLIDQNLLKGKLFPRLGRVTLSKTGAFAFVDKINEKRFLSGKSVDSWMG